MAVKELAEAIILVSIEDLCFKNRRKKSKTFFFSQDFSFWSNVAGMTISDRKNVISLARRSFTEQNILKRKGISKRLQTQKGV